MDAIQEHSQASPSKNQLEDQLIHELMPKCAPLGFEIIQLEITNHPPRVIRLFIDHIPQSSLSSPALIGIEDCATVSRAVEPFLESALDSLGIFQGGTYELEVSSPGLDRPLRFLKDFARFIGRETLIRIDRPLSAEEMGHPEYYSKNSKQKKFQGRLHSVQGQTILLSVPFGKASATALIQIPFATIMKANLEIDEGEFR